MPHDACAPTSVSDPVVENRLRRAFALIAGFMVVEIVGGLFSGSLALLADAAHMALDAAALGVALLAHALDQRLARSGASGRFRQYAAAFNGGTLVVLTLWMAFEAFSRIEAPEPVLAGPLVSIASLGLAVNILAYRILHPASSQDANVRAASLHVLGDILGSVAAIGAGLVILATGWTPIDPALSLVVAGIVFVSAVRLLRELWTTWREHASVS